MLRQLNRLREESHHRAIDMPRPRAKRGAKRLRMDVMTLSREAVALAEARRENPTAKYWNEPCRPRPVRMRGALENGRITTDLS